ncbi:MAG: phosphate acyltransferase PlsX [bacterium]
MKVALDAMGGDFAPHSTVEGAVAAVRELREDLQVLLVGEKEVLASELSRHDYPASRISIVPASKVVRMTERPVQALRENRDSSLLRAIELHRDGEADAVVSAGHTGVQVAASLMMLGRIEGVRRPTIGSYFPTENGIALLLDVGANMDCKPHHMLQFAAMGAIFVEHFFERKPARVGLLNIGEEKTKGDRLALSAHYLLERSDLHFVGNVEGRDIFRGAADVIVCDGFVGNILLKFAETIYELLAGRFQGVLQGEPASEKLKEVLRGFQKDFDYAEHGGVPLLGLNGISIICHGRSPARAMKNAIREAVLMVERKIPQAIREDVEQYHAGLFSRGIARLHGYQEWRERHSRETD